MAAFYANLTAAAWEIIVNEAAPELTVFSYLDDRLIVGTSACAFEAAIAATLQLDRALGPSLNVNKSFRSQAGGRLQAVGPLLNGFLLSSAAISYLGIDLIVRCPHAGTRARAATRVNSIKQRCKLIRVLSSAQRGNLVADAISSLWLQAGTLLSKQQTADVVSATADALRGCKRAGQVQNHSRPAEHLIFSPGAYRSHPAVAAIYACMQQAVRFFTRHPDMLDRWHLLWAMQSRFRIGPFAQARWALDELGMKWLSSTTVQLATPLAQPDDLQRWDFQACIVSADKPLFWHNLRDLLRKALWATEAARRPKDFDGAEFGVDAKSLSSIRKAPGGTTLMSAGQWTSVRLHRAGKVAVPTCVRCGEQPETLGHRLWLCPKDADLRASLARHLVVPVCYRELPACLRRAALIPANTWLVPSDANHIVSYLYAVSRRATLGLLRTHRDLVDE
jgi:hypothetical protein